MYDYFKHIAMKNSCSMGGVCSVHPSVNSLYELLLYEIKEISNYLVKLHEFNILNPSAMSFCIEILSVFMINTSFNQTKYLNLIKKLYSLKKEIKEKYINYCKENKLPCEVLNSDFELSEDMTINQLINISQENIATRKKGYDKTKLGLFELVSIFSRLCAINIVKIKKLESNYTDYDFDLIRFFALTSASSIKNEKIKRRICQFAKTALEIKKKLFGLYKKNYGEKTDATINLSAIKGHSILVSGDDIDELYDLVQALNYSNTKDEINVYTNGALFLAHMYPYFKNNKFIKGHWGGDSAEYDFANFPGAILITRNFVQKIDSLYRGELFSNKLISFDKVFDIKNKDYMPVIQSALRLDGFMSDEEKKQVEIKYEKDKILNSLEEIIEPKVAIVVGGLNKNISEHYNDKTIINLSFSYEIEFIFEIINKLKAKNIDVTVFFAQCNMLSLENILILINNDINLAMVSCPHAFINPHITDSLKDEFNVRII